MSGKPLKILFKTFFKNQPGNVSYYGQQARDYMSIFFSEKCDLFVGQQARIQPGVANPDTSIGALTRRYDSSVQGTINPTVLQGWIPGYFFDAVRLDTTTPSMLCDKVSMPPGTSLQILNTAFFLSPVKEAGSLSANYSGVHCITFLTESGIFVLGSFCQQGTPNTVDQSTNLTAAINNITTYAGSNPFVLCCNLELRRFAVINAINASGSNVKLFQSPNGMLTNVTSVGLVTTLDASNYFITKGVDITVDLLPATSTTALANVTTTNVEFQAAIITCNNIIKSPDNNNGIYNTNKAFFLPTGTLVNNL